MNRSGAVLRSRGVASSREQAVPALCICKAA